MRDTPLFCQVIGNLDFITEISQLSLQRDWNQDPQIVKHIFNSLEIDCPCSDHGSATCTSYVTLGNSLRILLPERRLLDQNSCTGLGNEGEIKTYCVKPQSFEVVCYTDLHTLMKSKGTEDWKVIKAWKASRKGSIKGLGMCRDEAVDNLPVSFIMNNLGTLVC